MVDDGSNLIPLEGEIDYCREREQHERQAADLALNARVRDVHVAMAERYADRAWSLAEQGDGSHIPSGLWPIHLSQ